jgi:hypothetical protein
VRIATLNIFVASVCRNPAAQAVRPEDARSLNALYAGVDARISAEKTPSAFGGQWRLISARSRAEALQESQGVQLFPHVRIHENTIRQRSLILLTIYLASVVSSICLSHPTHDL